MKNLTKLTRSELKTVKGGDPDPNYLSDGGGCEPGHQCLCGAIYNNFGPATPTWDCCACPPKHLG